MNTRYPHLPFEGGEEKIVYVRPVAVADLPEEVQAQAGGLDHIYSVNGADGTRLALVANRHLAFVLAREHDFAPVNVH
ncbi:hypothetical protein CEW89_18055 [Celeribacter ethanolicus]|uniref:DUF1150 domain-containing protein n=1 Tax=Celeribacter ethanolicus TaxID=1758178 RepID=A0A291GGX8_9RHOB|nr:DUF1150 family protein [Celeribacter ethanolicus]ATG49312.1 hypothetical protein CEW89_18055 [Celeribacter ethanolicus]